ncbi:MAG: DNA-binding response regulator [Chloroflexi bacterium HGW-Chloroflexi-4]|jgi:DNA-binding response OmpR family regulator|nr:MAG: DNA-binding response regulator [Chloroflexi bacterium HGW-Chloroflexi-7]PKN99296.1 MAG: DNA-binding response regulator [Chloroflexi bacterium HGW-Chloroflexi-4]
MPKIIIVEDEPSISEVVSLYLNRAGFEVTTFADGLEAHHYLALSLPDLVILDVMLPGMDGFALIRSIRDRSDVPVILLTSRREESDRIAGLELGADDYVVKPFSPQELVSRVRAVLRRTQTKLDSPAQANIQAGNLNINPQTREVLVNGSEIILTAKEFDLLYHLATHPRQVFSRDQLLESIWGLRDFIDPSTVTVHIRRLREKIEKDPTTPTHLVTTWGVGYKFDP